jgi:biopolymer transport protein ExbD
MSLNGSILDRRVSNKKAAGLNLVSLMDIFSILVFFLLMNSGESPEAEKASYITMPESQAKGSFQNDLLIVVGHDFISIKDEDIVSIVAAKKVKGKVIPELAAYLKTHAEGLDELTKFEAKSGRPITIMGDQSVPYSVLKAVMASCSQENFRDIALAVSQVLKGVGDIQAGEPL